ncbi:site-specific integrase [Allosalinactinospora lopnorensis]|uniref:hypothetical protein n=1 Tax=Allosalinactinospora lopnorensis TaxID=1352348 RepID=UPI000A9D43CA|nr:hypothetical protein [Allosalinactinospora lopnorensis]
MLLYAQPASRIVLLTTDDITQDDGQVFIRFGDPPTLVPSPFDGLLLRARHERGNAKTSASADSPWLFPGQAGRPLNSLYLAALVGEIGIPSGSVRSAALRQLVLQAPAPVIARALGFHDKTTTRIAASEGGAWNRYATSDHTQ